MNKETNQDMCLGPILFVVENRPHAKIVFLGAEGVFHFGKLDVGVPQRFRIDSAPVGTQDIAAAGLKCPLVTIFVLFDIYGKSSLFTCAGLRNLYAEQRGGPAVTFQESANPALDFLSVFGLARLRLSR